MRIAWLKNLKDVQRCQRTSWPVRFNEREIIENTTRITTKNANSMHSTVSRIRDVSFIAAEIHPVVLKSASRQCDRVVVVSLEETWSSPLRLSNSTKFQSFFMVYGSHRATESAITTGIAWLHNITAQGKLSLYLFDFISIRLYLYKNCLYEEFYVANLMDF